MCNIPTCLGERLSAGDVALDDLLDGRYGLAGRVLEDRPHRVEGAVAGQLGQLQQVAEQREQVHGVQRGRGAAAGALLPRDAGTLEDDEGLHRVQRVVVARQAVRVGQGVGPLVLVVERLEVFPDIARAILPQSNWMYRQYLPLLRTMMS